MHPNPIFRDPTRARAMAEARGFGTLSICGTDGPLAAHVPFVLDGETALIHLVRSNPIARALDTPQAALLSVLGPDGYVSPDWYGDVPDQVPTWNYCAVHMRGTLERLPDADLREVIDAQTANFENRLRPKTPWTSDKMSPEAMARMMRQIVPCRLAIAHWDATEKLSQNKPDAVRLSAASAMETSTVGQETAALAALMRDVPGD